MPATDARSTVNPVTALPGDSRGQRLAWVEAAAVLLLTAMAFALRFYRLAEIPPGFHHDEAFEAVEALKVLAGGYHPLFFEGNFGVEPMFIYLTALAFKLFGASPTVMRGVAAIMGSLTVPALYSLGKELQRASRRPLPGLGVAAAAVLAGLYWHVTFSRVGIEPVLVPLDAILMSVFLWRGLRTRRAVDFALSGLFLGLSPYTYPAARLLPFLLLAFVLYLAAVDFHRWRTCWKHFVLLGAVAFIVFLPLGITFASQPDLLTLRTTQVAVVAEGQGSEDAGSTIVGNLVSTLRGLSFVGDQDPRSNLPERPLLDPILSVGFYAGLAIALWRWRDPVAGFVLLWLGMMLVPTILSEYAPHFRRAIGAVPAVALLAGWLPAAVLEWLPRRARDLPGRMGAHALVPAVLLLFSLGLVVSVALTARDYFVRWASHPALFYAYDVGLTGVAQRIATEPESRSIYLSPRSPDHPTLAFFLWDHARPRRFDGRYCFVLPPDQAPATYWIIRHEDWRAPALFERYLPQAEPAVSLMDAQDQPYAQAYRQPAGAIQTGEPPIQFEAQFDDWLNLLGWEPINPTLRAGDVLYLDLYWQPTGRTSRSYITFVHLLGQCGSAAEGPVCAGSDSVPGAGSCPTKTWVPGETIIDQIQVQIPLDAPAGTYDVEIGWYDQDIYAATGGFERLKVKGADGQPGRDSLILGQVTIEPGS